jgi:hypothetical protein
VQVAVWGCALSCRTTPLVSIPCRLFWIDLYAAFHNKPLLLLWSLVPRILSTKFPYDFVNEFVNDDCVSSVTTFVMHISAPIPEFSAPFSHTTVNHNIITVYTTPSTINLGRALSFCVKKSNHSTYLTAGGSSDDSVHVSSAITPTLRSENA